MKGYIENIEDLTKENTHFRHVLYSGTHLQLVMMCISPGEQIDGETHSDTDQFFRVEHGKGRINIDGVLHKLRSGTAVVIPAGAHHNLICTGDKPLKVHLIYGPPHHMDKLKQNTKAEAHQSGEPFDGISTEARPETIRV